jgi:hypothetical protein
MCCRRAGTKSMTGKRAEGIARGESKRAMAAGAGILGYGGGDFFQLKISILVKIITMKLFISHAIRDKQLLKKLKINLEPYGIKLLIAEHFEDLEDDVTEKIEKLIETSDAALILLTENGFNSVFVQQEIGYIKKANKPYLQLIQKGIKIKGFNYAKGGIELDPENPEIALRKSRKALLDHWKKMQNEKINNVIEVQKKIALQAKSKQEEKLMNIGLGIGIGFLLVAVFLND